MKFIFLLLLLSISSLISVNYAYAEGIILDRSIYPHPTEGNPLTIYVTAPSEVTISIGNNWNNLQVLGTTSSGVFTINYDDLDSFEDVILLAKYYDDVKLKEYQKSAMFDDWKSTLQIDQPLYVVNDVVALTLIDPAQNYDSRSADTFMVSEVEINLTYDVGVIPLSNPIFATTMFTETGNHTGVFQATMTIPEKIDQYEIHYEETILKPTDGNEVPLTITDAIGSFSTEPNEISIDLGDTVTWYSDEEYTVVAGDPDVDSEKLGVLYPHGFNSGIIEEGVFAHEFDVSGMFSHKFDVLGKYPYYDKLNSQMKGVIIVGGLYGTPNDSITNESQDSQIINCSVGTYLVDGVCKPRPDLIETTSVSLTSDNPKILNTNNERVSTAHVGETLFVDVEIENLGDNTKDFVASYRYLASSVGDWSEWTWVSSSVNAGKYSDVAIPWNPTKADNYEFDIQIWDNVSDKTIITTEKLIVTVKTTTSEVQEKIDEIEKINLEDEYFPTERKWITSGPFQIDRNEYAIGEKIFIKISELETDEKGEIIIMRLSSSAQYTKYLIIPFDGSKKSSFNYYLEPKISTDNGIFSIDDLIGEWKIVFEGTTYQNLQFKITEKILSGTNTESKPRPSFVDETKDPQSYIDRYNNESSYKEWFDENFPDYTIHEAVGLPEPAREKVPGWIKNNAKWWSDGQIDDNTFVGGIQHLMKEKIVDIPDLPEQASEKAKPNFVDDSQDPQSYVDRYNNEAEYKEWFDENYPDYTIEEAVGVTAPIPGWIKNTASWWSEGLITEDEFIKGIEFLVEKRILNVN